MEKFQLPPRIYHWIVPLPSRCDVDRAGFSNEELARAALLHNSTQQKDLLQRRKFIHETVAPVLGLNARECSVTHLPNGQPRLRDITSGRSIYLSISTTKDYFAVAASLDCPVGIDMEPILERDVALLARILGPLEQIDVNSRSPIDAMITATIYWTRKEAYLKLHGLGLMVEPRDVEMPALAANWENHWQPLALDNSYSVVSWSHGQNIVSICAPNAVLPGVISSGSVQIEKLA